MKKAVFIVGGIILLLAFVVFFFRVDTEEGEEVRPISVLLVHMHARTVERIEIAGDTLTVTLLGGSSYETQKESGSSLFTIFADNNIDASGVEIAVEDQDASLADWASLLINFIPIFIFIGIIYALIRAINRIPRQ